jgi:hypothetical protein
VKEVVSHTQALQQCSNFLKANPNIKVTIFENTATAAKYVAESGRTDLAALSSTDCAKLYGLHVLQDGVQNNENNYTRVKAKIKPAIEAIKNGDLTFVPERFDKIYLHCKEHGNLCRLQPHQPDAFSGSQTRFSA